MRGFTPHFSLEFQQPQAVQYDKQGNADIGKYRHRDAGCAKQSQGNKQKLYSHRKDRIEADHAEGGPCQPDNVGDHIEMVVQDHDRGGLDRRIRT